MFSMYIVLYIVVLYNAKQTFTFAINSYNFVLFCVFYIKFNLNEEVFIYFDKMATLAVSILNLKLLYVLLKV